MDSRVGSGHQCFETVLSVGTRQYSGLMMLGARVLVRKKDKFKALDAAGVATVRSLAELGSKMQEVIGG